MRELYKKRQADSKFDDYFADIAANVAAKQAVKQERIEAKLSQQALDASGDNSKPLLPGQGIPQVTASFQGFPRAQQANDNATFE